LQQAAENFDEVRDERRRSADYLDLDQQPQPTQQRTQQRTQQPAQQPKQQWTLIGGSKALRIVAAPPRCAVRGARSADRRGWSAAGGWSRLVRGWSRAEAEAATWSCGASGPGREGDDWSGKGADRKEGKRAKRAKSKKGKKVKE
jgi:hypothetical protein